LDYFPHLFRVNHKGDTTLSKGYYQGLYPATSHGVSDVDYSINEKQIYFAGYFKDEVTGKIRLYVSGTNTNFDLGWTSYGSSSPTRYFIKTRVLPNGNLLLVQSWSGGKTNLFIYSPQGERLDSAVIQSSFTSLIIRDVLVNDDSTITIAGQAQSLAYLAKIDIRKLLVTGLEEGDTEKQSFGISPNPSNGILNLTGFQFGNFEIYDAQGALLRKVKVQSVNQQINVQDLNSGTYLYRFSMEDGVRYGKIVKQ